MKGYKMQTPQDIEIEKLEDFKDKVEDYAENLLITNGIDVNDKNVYELMNIVSSYVVEGVSGRLLEMKLQEG
jgi:hypothetical protein|tara:strand:+ start:73 stop:288 length:216 start_codon:yes stop_codon:yes gene_type:complete